jgi:hypothetical protein
MKDLMNLAFDPYIVQIALQVLFLAAAFITLRVVLKIARKILSVVFTLVLIAGVVFVVTQYLL